MADQALLLQFGQRLELGGDRARLRGALDAAADAQVDDVEHVEPEVPQVVVDLLAQLRRRAGVRPPALLVAAGADLRDDVQIVGYGASASRMISLVTYGP